MRQFGEKPAYMGQRKSIIRQTAVLMVLMLQTMLTISHASTTNNVPQKAKWYRYYDHKGVANISSNVTPTIFVMAMKP